MLINFLLIFKETDNKSKGAASVIELSIIIAGFLLAMSWLFYPHWVAFLMLPFVGVLLFAATHAFLRNRQRRPVARVNQPHPKHDDAVFQKPLIFDPSAGDDTKSRYW